MKGIRDYTDDQLVAIGALVIDRIHNGIRNMGNAVEVGGELHREPAVLLRAVAFHAVYELDLAPAGPSRSDAETVGGERGTATDTLPPASHRPEFERYLKASGEFHEPPYGFPDEVYSPDNTHPANADKQVTR